MLGIDRITHFDRARLEVGSCEFAQLFAGDPQVGRPVIWTSCCQDGT